MRYEELYVLIPSHSLEDFPTELGEKPASSLLNAFAVLWHPVLLAGDAFPRWQRADSVNDVRPNRLVVIPSNCQSLIPGGWTDRARREGMTVVSGLTDRKELLNAVLAPLGAVPEVDPDLAADFLALGTAYLQMELLARHMRNFSPVDEVHLQRDAIAAAKAAVEGDRTAAETHLKHCFVLLLECRERFYPVDCYLLDLCLVIPRLANDKLLSLAAGETAVSLLAAASDWETIAAAHPPLIAQIRDAWGRKRIDVVGGEWEEVCTPLLSLETLLWQFRRGRRAMQELFGRLPSTWGRRRYGVGPMLPQVLSRHGYAAALHFVMDDGRYPDDEHGKLRWQGCDGSIVDAISRIPLAGDSASAFLRFAVRMAESMDHDHVASVVFARWPEMRTPWLEDLRRVHRYAPVFGRFITLEQFFATTEAPGRVADYKAEDYLSPFLIQSVAQNDADPVSRYVDYWERRHHYESAAWCDGVVKLLQGLAWSARDVEAHEDVLEAAGPQAPRAAIQEAHDAQARLAQVSTQELARLLARGDDHMPGWLVINPLSFPRKMAVKWPVGHTVPVADPAIVARQFDDQHRTDIVDVPACGFVWLPRAPSNVPTSDRGKVPTAEELVLRNEFFEVGLSPATGGIAQIRTYRRSPNRLSQQLALRFSQEKTGTRRAGEEVEEYRTFYSEMRMKDSRVLCAGPGLGEIETVGELVDPADQSVLAEYRQQVRVYRGRPFVELDMELDLKTLPEGDPWTNYYGVRCAWKHTTASLTRSLQQTAHLAGEQLRLEAPHFIELADDAFRTTLLPLGLPFHRRIGDRMLDTLLITAGETRRRFRMAIAIDQSFPLQAALDVFSEPVLVATEHSPPPDARSGWFFHVNSKNVQITRLLPVELATSGPAEGSSASNEVPAAASVAGNGCVVRLLETEGRSKTFQLRCCRTPTKARQRDFRGETLNTLSVAGDAVTVTIAAYEICDVELLFG